MAINISKTKVSLLMETSTSLKNMTIAMSSIQANITQLHVQLRWFDAMTTQANDKLNSGNLAEYCNEVEHILKYGGQIFDLVKDMYMICTPSSIGKTWSKLNNINSNETEKQLLEPLVIKIEDDDDAPEIIDIPPQNYDIIEIIDDEDNTKGCIVPAEQELMANNSQQQQQQSAVEFINVVRTCPICYEDVQTEKTMFAPCSHFICDTCYYNLRTSKCPMCNGDVASYLQYYRSGDNILFRLLDTPIDANNNAGDTDVDDDDALLVANQIADAIDENDVDLDALANYAEHREHFNDIAAVITTNSSSDSQATELVRSYINGYEISGTSSGARNHLQSFINERNNSMSNNNVNEDDNDNMSMHNNPMSDVDNDDDDDDDFRINFPIRISTQRRHTRSRRRRDSFDSVSTDRTHITIRH